MKIDPASSIKGEISVPGDKSISHRYAILGAAAQGETHIDGFSSCADCSSTLDCVAQLGAQVQREKDHVVINSHGWQNFKAPFSVLDAGNSGTTIRLLSGLLAGCPFSARIAGDTSLNRRPMMRIVEPLTSMGAVIETSDTGTPPLVIKGRKLTGIRYPLPIASAQVKSCVLLAGLTASGRTTVIEKKPSRDHTERAFQFFDLPFEKKGSELSIGGPVQFAGTELSVPGDFSSAVFFIIAALLLPESDLVIRNVGINPTRSGLLQLLVRSGARIRMINQRETSNELRCDIHVTHSDRFLQSFPQEITPDWVPIIIDEFPILAILGTRLEKGLVVKGAEELRKKESDRINSISRNLRSIGIKLEEFQDGFNIFSNQVIQGGNVETFGDHRIAMSFAVGALISKSGLEIDDPQCANVSFPGFFETMEKVTVR